MTQVLQGERSIEVVRVARSNGRRDLPASISVDSVIDARACTVADLSRVIAGADWVINCIGLIKPLINDCDGDAVEAALRVNGLFPHLLSAAAREVGCRVVQIATDCVYSGRRGRYDETDAHDALDVYGKTKSLGEVPSPAVFHVRCSIIGREVASRRSLVEWLLGQVKCAQVDGFANHYWNGVTTLQFARLCRGIISSNLKLPPLCHFVPSDAVSKLELLELIKQSFHRSDIEVRATEPQPSVDRTLRTILPDVNSALWDRRWRCSVAPSISQMLRELGASPSAQGNQEHEGDDPGTRYKTRNHSAISRHCDTWMRVVTHVLVHTGSKNF